MSATSTSHNTANSYAFLINPLRLLEKVTWREVVLTIFTIGTFTLPIGLLFATKWLGLKERERLREREEGRRDERERERERGREVGGAERRGGGI